LVPLTTAAAISAGVDDYDDDDDDVDDSDDDHDDVPFGIRLSSVARANFTEY
jgi:hypothetical protein